MEKKIEQNKIEELKAMLSGSKKILITSHARPDGDAVGSSLAWYSYLKNEGHNVSAVVPDAFPDFFNWMESSADILKADAEGTKVQQLMVEADIIFCLDYNDPVRFGSLGNKILSVNAKKVLIDHHLNPVEFSDIEFSYPQYAATAEIIFDILTGLNAKVSKGMAEAMYTGIMTDTGSFRFPSTTAHTHNIISSLISAGAIHNEIYDLVYDNYSLDRMKFVGHCLLNKLEVFAEHHFAVIKVDKDELAQFNHQPGDSEGIVNEALAIKGVSVAALFTERENMIRISFRSKGNFSVKEIAQEHFGGGGHQNAAGGKSTDTLEKAVQKFIELMPQYSKNINA
ncbi:MAG: bifunctional oligoribonuclease/PAP phosphatase NrnA [Bacteroidia bacterium]|nr:bifunctional oligoribonuclease/PAP phosphatase NrnA [Bacteroidia bacterium]